MKRSTVLLYAGTALAVLASALLVEGAARLAGRAAEQRLPTSVPALLQALPHAKIHGREIGNQMLVHNVALFAQDPHRQDVDKAFVGTSRTKVLRPRWMGELHAVNASGNSYNEISYGLLLQAEVARLMFPGIKQVYVEASLLLRRPPRLVLEPDHRKYLPLLDTLLPLCDQLPDGQRSRAEVARAETAAGQPFWRPHLRARRAELRFSNLLPWVHTEAGGIPVQQDELFTSVDARGERKAAPASFLPTAERSPEVREDNIKVQRLRDVAGWAPWDRQFDLFALWGRAHGIQVILFQPPVRSDLYRFQDRMGLQAHVQDLQRVARQYGIPFIDLDRPELGYMQDWTLFADEDHLETCAGVVLLYSALRAGAERFGATGELLPIVPRAEAERRAGDGLRRCDAKAAA